MVDTQRQKHLVLILAREFASNLATPTVIADARGNLVYYNEAAEAVVGRRFSEAEMLPMDDWIAAFEPRTRDAEPLPADRRRQILRQSISGLVPCAIATALAAVSAYLTLAICGAIAAYYALPIASGGNTVAA